VTRLSDDQRDHLLATVLRSGPGFRLVTMTLLAVVAWAVYAWTYQLRHGLAVTGMHDRVPWGVYIVAFVFFIGISHAGTLVSAILRLSGAEWRRPITRMAEVITAVALMMGALMPLVDMGRPERIINIATMGRLQSPILWDLISIGTYLTGSLIYLYVPLIPDLAMLRDRLSDRVGPFRRWCYRVFALGWQGTPRQRARLERVLGIMAILIIPIAVSVHTVVSWLFAMTVRPGWHSTIFGPYFVIGAIFSGIAGIITAMYLFRRVYRLEAFITRAHFVKLGYLMLTLNLAYLYFTFAEYLTIGYGFVPKDRALLEMLFTGPYATAFWTFVVAGLFIPALVVALPWTRTVAGITIASLLVNLGMWLKRFVIVVPSQAVPQMPYELVLYQPTWVEWSILAGTFAGFTLLYLTFARYLPIISVWEVDEEPHASGVAPVAVAPPSSTAAQAGGFDD
jgi:Ni/Fe-hydrogenase subunit HybB-like protein